jgi:Phosphotransferase enzyme family
LQGKQQTARVSSRKGVGIVGFRVKEHQRKALSPFDQYVELAIQLCEWEPTAQRSAVTGETGFMSWLSEPSLLAVAEAVQAVAPELSGLPVDIPDLAGRDYAGRQIARFLAALHGAETRRRLEAVTGSVPAWYPLVTTRALRERFGRWVTPEQQRKVVRWCDWADEVLAEPRPRVLVHGDLHGDNQVWYGGELKAVIDFENVGTGEPEYDLRAFPGPGMGPGLELLTAIIRQYEGMTGREVSVERLMAWHLRQTLGDALWRSEAGLPLPDRRTPGEWVADMAARLNSLGGPS